MMLTILHLVEGFRHLTPCIFSGKYHDCLFIIVFTKYSPQFSVTECGFMIIRNCLGLFYVHYYAAFSIYGTGRFPSNPTEFLFFITLQFFVSFQKSQGYTSIANNHTQYKSSYFSKIAIHDLSTSCQLVHHVWQLAVRWSHKIQKRVNSK